MRRALAAMALSLSLTGQALACDAPDVASVEIPAGSSASEGELLAAQRAVAELVAAIEAFTACVDANLDNQRLSPSARRQLVRERDDAVDAAHRLATRMNREIRNFNRASTLASG